MWNVIGEKKEKLKIPIFLSWKSKSLHVLLC